MKQILAIIITLIPLIYGIYQLYKAHRITQDSTEEQLVEIDSYLQRIKKSGSLFTLVGVFMVYEFYKIFIR